MRALTLFLSLLVAASLSACTKSPESPTLRLFTWSEYFNQQVIDDFTAATGVRVKLDYFSSNEEMLTKLQLTADGPGYDLILPSDYMVRTLSGLDLLQDLDHARLAFLKDFPPEGRSPVYDPGLKHAVPLTVGTTGLAWNTKLLPKMPARVTWRDVFERHEWKGKVTLLDDTKEALQAALLAQGKTLAAATESDIRSAFRYLRAYKDQFKGFTTETRPAISSGECALCMAYSGDVRAVAKDHPEIKFILPVDGATIWTDNFAIPKNARNTEAAYAFLNHLLSPQAARDFTVRTGYRTFLQSAKPLLPEAVANDPLIFPPAGGPALHYLASPPELASLIEREWALLRAD